MLRNWVRKGSLVIAGALLLMQAIPSSNTEAKGSAAHDSLSELEAIIEEAAASGQGSGERGSYVKESYSSYISRYANAARPEQAVTIAASEFAESGGRVEKLASFAGVGSVVKTDETGYIEWELNIPETGLYHIAAEYYPVEGKSSSIERELWIDGELPFEGARRLTFDRIWRNENESIRKDNRGNELRPNQVEAPEWRTVLLEDSGGYVEGPYSFYLERGKHRIRLVSVREPMIIGALTFYQAKQPPTYEAHRSELAGMAEAEGLSVKVQGEAAVSKSDPTLYPIVDRSSPKTEPHHVSQLRVNTIGGNNWKLPGQWISWNIEVPEDGLYRLGVKFKQNWIRGLYVNRSLYIDGELPFEEMGRIPFFYGGDWQMKLLGEETGEPYQFYLTKGTHTITMEASLGAMAKVLQAVESSLLELNRVYRSILMITGPTPDALRDYQLEKQLTDMVPTFKEQSELLFALAAYLEQITGERGSQAVMLTKLANQLKDLANKPESVPSRLKDFKLNVGGLGTWVLQVREQPLEIDYFMLLSPDQKAPRAGLNFWERMVYEAKVFTASFFNDYNSIGDVERSGEAVEVWIGTGRDQAQVLKAMIDDTFTRETGINVNLKLVDMGVLLPATVAREGPDVALQIDKATPVNFAMRNAVQDLSIFPDFEVVLARFNDSAVVPYRYLNGVYALPEQEFFDMMFYRKDVLDELGLKLPDTWDEFYSLLPELQKNYMEFAFLPESMSAYAMLLYQNGGEYYRGDGEESALDSEAALQAFERWVDLYSTYKMPVEFDFPNRFRTGEMPIGIADYTFYNTLQVFAPEIRGLWDFAPVPGTVQQDGSIRRDVASGGMSVMMMKDAEHKQPAWEFMKWWTRKDTQVRFGREMESILGASARYPTANLEALEELPWPVKDYTNLQEQWKWVRGIPEVPGGYFTPRHLDNAFRTAYFDGGNPREILLEYVEVMNEEISLKRKEFGIDKGD